MTVTWSTARMSELCYRPSPEWPRHLRHSESRAIFAVTSHLRSDSLPTLEHNLTLWNTKYAWRDQGDEWSAPWGGVDAHWYGSILPRIHQFVPASSILEIAPGFGRWTQFLKELSDRLDIVDLSPKCIDKCRERFASSDNIGYHVNDGTSLDFLADRSVDFVFTYDSLVHVEMDVLHAYIREIARTLTDDGVAFIHHSNMGEYASRYQRETTIPAPLREALRKRGVLNRRHFRSLSVTADQVASACEEAGLCCISQELVNWRQRRLIDAFSVFTRKSSRWARPNRVLRNPDFMTEAAIISRQAQLYSAR
jgi:SAM-dependent methyltransferase